MILKKRLIFLIFYLFNILFCLAEKGDCYDIGKLVQMIQPIKEKCNDPFDYDTCIEYYKCTAIYYEAYDNKKQKIIYEIMKKKLLQNTIIEDREEIGILLDNCYKKDNTLLIDFNKCFSEGLKYICPRLIRNMPEPPDCSKDNDE